MFFYDVSVLNCLLFSLKIYFEVEKLDQSGQIEIKLKVKWNSMQMVRSESRFTKFSGFSQSILEKLNIWVKNKYHISDKSIRILTVLLVYIYIYVRMLS